MKKILLNNLKYITLVFVLTLGIGALSPEKTFAGYWVVDNTYYNYSTPYSVTIPVPIVNVDTNYSTVNLKQSVLISWDTQNYSDATFCMGSILGPDPNNPNNLVTLNSSFDFVAEKGSGPSGTSNPIEVSNKTTTFKVRCENEEVSSGSCSGTYSEVVQVCKGTLGGNTCGFPDTDPCSQFTVEGCYVESNPWCHHACYVGTQTNTNLSCSGLTQAQCLAHSTCVWN